MDKKTQCAIIWRYLQEHGSINDDEARNICGSKRLSARIWDLKHLEGKPIARRDVYVKNQLGHKSRVSVYYLVEA